jgi:hypothetical protein
MHVVDKHNALGWTRHHCLNGHTHSRPSSTLSRRQSFVAARIIFLIAISPLEVNQIHHLSIETLAAAPPRSLPECLSFLAVTWSGRRPIE